VCSNPLAQRFIRALAAIFPRASQRSLHHGYTFMLASTLYSFSNNRRLDAMTHGKLRSDDFEAISGSPIPFIASGLIALCGERV
jgi:Tetracyclin repressor-like, C-terminal domain